ncbi:glycine--tRNA ligase [Mycoplasma sp. ES3157-GEN-MYC]|uniref:glycine--tRNA ligase n=1 Tax=Mycoplasma miroungigenitalium TaxID=754515 RepID=A0A6M4J8G1_9MOLU|nr:glycine--tRNA ligase [Mycoplasma miroungigenitalium]MBU4690187.1 glycine--tRNA ligase [Mycoplasma miroungigenitalium]MBU4691458.1 glycine--tRNA ligase [Mycoplasma miroungigenitalium]QJR43293.1 glycine--tRNA ligase [Mycoplasma miroungigenitalium]
MLNKDKNITTLINHLKASGFVFQGSEIYGGLANTWDYGPLGATLKDNIEAVWKRCFIQSEKNNYLLDSKILMNPQVWVTSGHVVNFNDPLIENKVNGKRYRADKLIEEFNPNIVAETLSFDEMKEFLVKNVTKYEGDKCEWSDVRKFNLMFETKQGVTEETKSKIYLRPETTQGIMVNFKNVQRSMRAKMPMGIGQVGKSFRNEVTPGNFIFRTREFEQMELEVFCHPSQADEIFDYYIDKSIKFVRKLGLSEQNTRLRAHDPKELSHYSSATSDIEYLFPFGWGELLGIANRTNYDLTAHQNATSESLEYLEPTTNEKYIPYVIEPSMGLDRLMFAILIEAYDEEVLENETRIVMHFSKELAPYKVAVLPLVKKLNDKATEIYEMILEKGISVVYDETASIGKRYRRQDAIGTPKCVTIDFNTLEDESVTIRDRDTMEQKRVKISELINHI